MRESPCARRHDLLPGGRRHRRVLADAHETTDMQTILNGVLHDELFSAHFATWAEMILGIAPEEEDEEGAADDSEGDKTE